MGGQLVGLCLQPLTMAHMQEPTHIEQQINGANSLQSQALELQPQSPSAS